MKAACGHRFSCQRCHKNSCQTSCSSHSRPGWGCHSPEHPGQKIDLLGSSFHPVTKSCRVGFKVSLDMNTFSLLYKSYMLIIEKTENTYYREITEHREARRKKAITHCPGPRRRATVSPSRPRLVFLLCPLRARHLVNWSPGFQCCPVFE